MALLDADILDAARAAFGPDAARLLTEEMPSAPAAGAGLDDVVARLDARYAATPAAPNLDAGRLAKRREAATLVRCVVAHAAGMRWAFRMDQVVEIVAVPSITPLPGLPDWALGIANLRGDIASVVDLATFLRLPEAAAADRTHERIVLARSAAGDLVAGLRVDRIEGARGLPLDRVQRGGVDLPARAAAFAAGALPQAGGALIVLDLETLLADADFRRFDGIGT